MKDHDKPDNVIRFPNRDKLEETYRSKAVIVSLEVDNPTFEDALTNMIFDPHSTIRSFSSPPKPSFDRAALSKILGVLCDNDVDLFELLNARQTAVFPKGDNDWLEYDLITTRPLTREESIARTLTALGGQTRAPLPVPYRGFYKQKVEQVKRETLTQARLAIVRMDAPPVPVFNDVHLSIAPRLWPKGNSFGKTSLLLDSLINVFASTMADTNFTNPWRVLPIPPNRAHGRDKVTAAKLQAGYVVKAGPGPKKHGDRNATHFVKDVKPHPLLKGLIKKTEK